MRRLGFDTYATAFRAAYLCLVTNALLVAGCLPLVFLLVATDPTRSWPLVAVAVPLAAPSVSAAFVVFREHAAGGADVVRTFLAGWRATAPCAVQVAGIATAVVVVVLVDIRFLAGSPAGVVFVPALAVLAGAVITAGPVAIVAVAEAPGAGVARLLRVCGYLALRRWPVALLTVAALVAQFALFAAFPAIALGFTAAPTLYVAWANGRYVLAPALAATDAPPPISRLRTPR